MNACLLLPDLQMAAEIKKLTAKVSEMARLQKELFRGQAPITVGHCTSLTIQASMQSKVLSEQ